MKRKYLGIVLTALLISLLGCADVEGDTEAIIGNIVETSKDIVTELSELSLKENEIRE